MTREKKFSCLIAAVLAFCISFGGMACIVTGFSLATTDGSVSARFYSVPVNLSGIFLFCALISAVAAVCFSFRRGGWFLLGTLALLLGYLWRSGVLEVSLEAALYRITYVYDRAYRWGVVKWTGASPPETSPDLGYCIMAAILALLTAWTVCHRRSAIIAVIAGFAPLVACLVVTDSVPAVWCLFLLLTGQVLLMLTNTVRRQDLADGNRLTALLMVPVLLFMMLLFWAVPSAGYEAKADSVQQSIVSWFQSLPLGQLFGVSLPGSGTGTGAVDLTAVGPKTELYYAVMDVTGAEDGLLYLRGQSLDVYSGKTWKASSASTGTDNGWPTQNMTTVGTVKVSTISGHAAKYFPYYPSGGQWPSDRAFKEGRLDNPYRQRSYSFTQMRVTQNGSGSFLLSEQMREQCLALPQNTEVYARSHLNNISGLSDAEVRKIAEAIGDYVRSSARYDLQTEKMPSYENDFAMWFLNESDSGYCVHFATAATVLLRAAGVPARYVSGYVASAKAGKAVTVTANRAHAWVEYFDPAAGWQVLDPTPVSWEEDPEETTAPVQTTEPDASEPSTEPNIRPTQPDETTVPALDPTLPSQDSQGGGDQPQKVDAGWLWTVLKWLGIMLGVCAAVAGQYLLRLRHRRKRMHTGPVNQRALARWRTVLRMSRILKQKPPERLLELAEKARFSQHDLTVGERMEFDRYLDQAELELSQRPWLKRWMIRLVWAV